MDYIPTPEELFQMAKGAMKPQIVPEFIHCPFCNSDLCGLHDAMLDGSVLAYCYKCNQQWGIEPDTTDPLYFEMFVKEAT